MSYAEVIPFARTRVQRNTQKKQVLDAVFTYTLPTGVSIKIGQEVEVPFGARMVRGIVTNITEKTTVPHEKLKEVSTIEEASYVLPPQSIQLARWIQQEYLCSLGQVMDVFVPKVTKNRTKERSKQKRQICPSLPCLTMAQYHADKVLRETCMPALLWGVTGSGKTEVYMREIARALAKDISSQVVVLVPEIGMIPQMHERIIERFPQEWVDVVHSRRSAGQRYQAFSSVADGTVRILLGTRSALFAPFQRLTSIIMDECHDDSYSSWEKKPYFHGYHVVQVIAKLYNARLVLGSATPSLEQIHDVKQQKLSCIPLKERVHQQQLPKVHIVDMKTSTRHVGGSSLLSWELQEYMRHTLEQKRQIILYLNRRGAATNILCQECGWQAQCPQCELPLVHHLSKGREMKQQNMLICHHCNYQATTVLQCADCQSTEIRYGGAGTERVEQEVCRLFPNVRVARMDADTTLTKHAHAELYAALQDHKIDILIGTQMVTKGLDLPAVDLVGVLNADSLMGLPDFRVGEKTFQLLTQVIGRTGRKENRGAVVLQTYNPDRSILHSIAGHDAATFYRQEEIERQRWNYPPYTKLIRLLIEEKRPEAAIQKANKTARALRGIVERLGGSLLGPAPAFLIRKQGKTRIQILLRIPHAVWSELRPALVPYVDEMRVEVHPLSTL